MEAGIAGPSGLQSVGKARQILDQVIRIAEGLRSDARTENAVKALSDALKHQISAATLILPVVAWLSCLLKKRKFRKQLLAVKAENKKLAAEIEKIRMQQLEESQKQEGNAVMSDQLEQTLEQLLLADYHIQMCTKELEEQFLVPVHAKEVEICDASSQGRAAHEVHMAADCATTGPFASGAKSQRTPSGQDLDVLTQRSNASLEQPARYSESSATWEPMRVSGPGNGVPPSSRIPKPSDRSGKRNSTPFRTDNKENM